MGGHPGVAVGNDSGVGVKQVILRDEGRTQGQDTQAHAGVSSIPGHHPPQVGSNSRMPSLTSHTVPGGGPLGAACWVAQVSPRECWGQAEPRVGRPHGCFTRQRLRSPAGMGPCPLQAVCYPPLGVPLLQVGSCRWL